MEMESRRAKRWLRVTKPLPGRPLSFNILQKKKAIDRAPAPAAAAAPPAAG